MKLREYQIPAFEGAAAAEAIVRGPNVRVTVLAPRLLRLEYDPTETFEDRPSQVVWFRNQPVPAFDVEQTEGTMVVETDSLRLEYDPGDGFTPETLSIELDDGTVWCYGDDNTNLGGPLRTVDGVDGPAPLEDGLLSREGWAAVSDTDSLVFEDGWVQPRDANEAYEDLYFFGYGTDFQACLQAYTEITGAVPMLPRWALGNWWSRYWNYTQDELRGVMESFRERDLPLSVCMIDMDWHVVENEFHDGWTGWTWNEEYFPDPAGFIDWLHDNGLRTSLNLHPADGVHPHEAQYEDFADFVGLDPESEEPIEFDAADSQFLRGYFEILINPMEDEEGIDFWWIDWQQWEESPTMDGLDPMWALNHLHALDRTRTGKRPFILSRWSGLGGHRYQVGFSGDAYISWESLRFQPHLTARSANVDYGWWSHDIGGHVGGTGDPRAFGELYARWTQFGVLSPINRIHTTQTPSVDKRPWTFGGEVSGVLAEMLRFRHRLIPYLYTMAWRDHTESLPLIRPMYFENPDDEAAYAAIHQYYFGSELVAAPHLSERDDDTNLARRSVWLPEGEWFDFHSGESSPGGRWHVRYGDLTDLPIYARAGAIVPLGPEVGWGGVENPETVQVVAFPGADNSFELYEDDGSSLAYQDGAYAVTDISQQFWDDYLEFDIGAPRGDLSQLPAERDYELQLRGVIEPDQVAVDSDSETVDISYLPEETTLVVEVSTVDISDGVTIAVDTEERSLVSRRDRTEEHVEDLIDQFRMPVPAKDKLRGEYWDRTDLDWLGKYSEVMTTAQQRALCETLTGVGMDLLDHDGTERVVLWNPGEREDVSFQHTSWDSSGLPHEHHGTVRTDQVPEFEWFELGGDDVAETVRLQYGDVLTVSCGSPATEE